MNIRHFLCKRYINYLSRFNPTTQTIISTQFNPTSTPSLPNSTTHHRPFAPVYPKSFHASPNLKFSSTSADPESRVFESEDVDDGITSEFLSRFVHIMRGKLNEEHPDADKQTIDGMLLVIVDKVLDEMEKGNMEQMLDGAESGVLPLGFSEDLWRTVWEVSLAVCQDIDREAKKEKMKLFLQSEEVKEMVRFASEVGIRGDMLRDFRFKWAREKMEESESYERLRLMREEEEEEEEEEQEQEEGEREGEEGEEGDGGAAGIEEVEDANELNLAYELPKRHGKIKYKIYGLDLSDPKWGVVADRIHEAEEMTWPQEAKPVTGKCRLVMESILSLKEGDDLTPLLAEWRELIQPSRVDWNNLLEKCKERNIGLYHKVAEHVVGEPAFQASVGDFSKLIDTHVKENRLEDAERVLKKMSDGGINPDVITLTILVRMYCKAGKLDRAKEAFMALRNQGFKPDVGFYSLMIKAYVSSGQTSSGEALVREMEARDMKPTEDIYMELLRSFSRQGDAESARRITTTMQFSGYEMSLESSTLLVEAYSRAGDDDQARQYFDHMMSHGHKPDDRCTGSMIAAYEKKNSLDKALKLLLQLEKEGFEAGVKTYSVLVDWMGKLNLIDEAEQILGKMAVLGEAPPLSLQVSLCDMYSRAGMEKKALQAVRVLEARKDELEKQDFERIIRALSAGNLERHAQRMQELMKSRGFQESESLKVSMMSSTQVLRSMMEKRLGKI